MKFCGYILSTNGYKLDPDLHVAVANFPKPSNITDLRSFFDLMNHLSDFTDVVALKLEPLRPLLKPRNDFLWEEPQERVFQDVKKALSTTPVMAYYDSKRATSLHVYASRLNGLGFVLNQQQPDGSWRMVQAMIEIELLGVVWAVQKCRIFLEGLTEFEIVTDHRPLVPILHRYCLNEIENPRLQHLHMKLLPYKFTATWRSGKQHCAPDALSRAPVRDPVQEDQLAEEEVE